MAAFRAHPIADSIRNKAMRSFGVLEYESPSAPGIAVDQIDPPPMTIAAIPA